MWNKLYFQTYSLYIITFNNKIIPNNNRSMPVFLGNMSWSAWAKTAETVLIHKRPPGVYISSATISVMEDMDSVPRQMNQGCQCWVQFLFSIEFHKTYTEKNNLSNASCDVVCSEGLKGLKFSITYVLLLLLL